MSIELFLLATVTPSGLGGGGPSSPKKILNSLGGRVIPSVYRDRRKFAPPPRLICLNADHSHRVSDGEGYDCIHTYYIANIDMIMIPLPRPVLGS